jgi:hypothetical protein
MTIRVRSLNTLGCDLFGGWIDNPVGAPPRELLERADTSEDVDPAFWIDEKRTFASSYELGKYLADDVFKDVTDRFYLSSMKGMWAWISLAFVEGLVRRAGKGHGKPLARAHYIDGGPRLSYRLIARTACDLVRLHGESAKVALDSRTTPWGEMAEQMTASQEIYVHPSLWPVAYHLYIDEGGSVRKGVTTQRSKKARRDPKSKAGLGGVRRLPSTFRQFDRTYNTRSMDVSKIIQLLPAEYSRWRQAE